jgi:cell division protein FtsB
MSGPGTAYVIEKLGQSLAAAEAEIERLRRENAVLREQVVQQEASRSSN